MRGKKQKSKYIDDIFVENVTLDIIRDGDARYTIRMTEGKICHEILLWTTNQSRIRIRDIESDDLTAVNLVVDDEGVLVSCSAINVDVHLENMDRNRYFLNFFSDKGLASLLLFSDRYIQARILDRQSGVHEA